MGGLRRTGGTQDAGRKGRGTFRKRRQPLQPYSSSGRTAVDGRGRSNKNTRGQDGTDSVAQPRPHGREKVDGRPTLSRPLPLTKWPKDFQGSVGVHLALLRYRGPVVEGTSRTYCACDGNNSKNVQNESLTKRTTTTRRLNGTLYSTDV